MDLINFIKEIETNYDIKSIEVNNIQVWGFLRYLYVAEFKKNQLDNCYNQTEDLNLYLSRFKNIFYGFLNLFRNYDYIILSSAMEKRVINCKYINKLFESTINILGNEKVLLIENPERKYHVKISDNTTKHIVSLDFFNLFWIIWPFKQAFKINNNDILDNINNKYSLKINYNKKISSFLFYTKIFSILFKIKRPKLFFVSCYYSPIYQAAIYSAKKKGIKVIEFQHGIINKFHPAYNLFIELDKDLFPDYLFTFGDNVKKIFLKDNYFIDPKKVVSVGNMYLDYIKDGYNLPEKYQIIFQNLRIKYTKIVAISSQITIENKLIEFLKKSALIDNNILYIFVPRVNQNNYREINLPENVVIFDDLNVYEIIKNSDFHATVYSTCALEAPFLGIPNILINHKNLSKEHYLDLLSSVNTRYANDENEFVNIIKNWNPKKSDIIESHKGFYSKSHMYKIKNALENLEKEDK